MLSKLKRLNYRHVLPDIIIVAGSFYASLFLRLGWDEYDQFLPVLNRHIFLFVVLRMGTFMAFGVYDIIWRYISASDILKLVRAVLVSSVLIIATSYVVDIARLPRATFFIDVLLVTIMLCGIRFSRRIVYDYVSSKEVMRHGRLTFIYGAGTNGRSLLQRLATDGDGGFRPIGFVDDNPQKVGRFIAGMKVLGTGAELSRLIQDYGIREIIIAVANPPVRLLRDIVQASRAFNITPRVITPLAQTPGSRKPIEPFRDVDLSDLLNRPRRQMELGALRRLVGGRRVLVTGAGGSIGSELARQILRLNPGKLILLDHSEYNLYRIDQELSASGDAAVVPVLVDIKDRHSLDGVFREHDPEIVFHAAAYKHVHLVEGSPLSSILNNIQGTRNLLELSEGGRVDTFVLISTDKAVNPVGVMGATKRVCELMVANAGKASGKRYCAVRFGNVLGSSGSLIPLLTEQIRNGQPVTITHEDMTRYFMLISEAVSLVLKASTIAAPGDITILNMGEPVKIVDIARSLVALMGKAEADVPFVYTGLRPGEKLFEELYICGNEMKTEDPDILVLPRGDGSEATLDPDLDVLWRDVDRIVRLAQAGSPNAVTIMRELIKSKTVVPEVSTPPAPGTRQDAPSVPSTAPSRLTVETVT